MAVLLAGAGLGLYRLHEPGVMKGGIAPLAKDAYVIVRGDRNEIRWQEGESVHHWIGKPRAQAETVCFDTEGVHRASWARVLAGKGFLVRFLPGRVDVIDLQKLTGWYYSPRTG
jgi:hypothetical protein